MGFQPFRCHPLPLRAVKNMGNGIFCARQQSGGFRFKGLCVFIGGGMQPDDFTPGISLNLRLQHGQQRCNADACAQEYHRMTAVFPAKITGRRGQFQSIAHLYLVVQVIGNQAAVAVGILTFHRKLQAAGSVGRTNRIMAQSQVAFRFGAHLNGNVLPRPHSRQAYRSRRYGEFDHLAANVAAIGNGEIGKSLPSFGLI